MIALWAGPSTLSSRFKVPVAEPFALTLLWQLQRRWKLQKMKLLGKHLAMPLSKRAHTGNGNELSVQLFPPDEQG